MNDYADPDQLDVERIFVQKPASAHLGAVYMPIRKETWLERWGFGR